MLIFPFLKSLFIFPFHNLYELYFWVLTCCYTYWYDLSIKMRIYKKYIWSIQESSEYESNLKRPIFLQISAVNCVLNSVVSKLGSECLRLELSRYFRIKRSAQLSKLLNCIFLPYFQSNSRSRGQLINESATFG